MNVNKKDIEENITPVLYPNEKNEERQKRIDASATERGSETFLS
jgi:hypothetical protein